METRLEENYDEWKIKGVVFHRYFGLCYNVNMLLNLFSINIQTGQERSNLKLSSEYSSTYRLVLRPAGLDGQGILSCVYACW